jgi:hypothetical protein
MSTFDETTLDRTLAPDKFVLAAAQGKAWEVYHRLATLCHTRETDEMRGDRLPSMYQ